MFDGRRLHPALPRRWTRASLAPRRRMSGTSRRLSALIATSPNSCRSCGYLRPSPDPRRIPLTLAFSGSFPDESTVFSYVLTAALLAAACSSLCFMARWWSTGPPFRLGGKGSAGLGHPPVRHGGLALLALAMLLSIWIVIAYLFTLPRRAFHQRVLAAVVVVLWIVVPLHFRAEVTSTNDD